MGLGGYDKRNKAICPERRGSNMEPLAPGSIISVSETPPLPVGLTGGRTAHEQRLPHHPNDFV